MTSAVLLDNVEHHDLRLRADFGPSYGDAINQVLIFPTEFEDIQREYPIFFRKDQTGAFVCVSILGLDREENLFLEDGEWRARYIPALQQRMGMLTGLKDDGEPAVFFDPAHPRLHPEGDPLFRPLGGQTPLLERISRALRLIHVGRSAAPAMFAAFEACQLIRPIEIDLKLSETRQFILSDFYTIDEAALSQLDGATLKSLNQAGFLAYAYFVISSRANLSRILEMKARKSL
ncbi:MAG: SapC family protein [Asticcacaulis sp.]